MKTQPIIAIFALSAIMITSNSFAQLSNVNNLQSSLNKPVKVYENVQLEFHKLFDAAENVRWEQVDKNYLAKFTLGNVEQRALLSPRGKLIYKIMYGQEKHLPTDMRKGVKRSYVEYIITQACLIEENDRSIWIIKLEDDSNYVTVRVENGEIEQVQKYRKARS